VRSRRDFSQPQADQFVSGWRIGQVALHNIFRLANRPAPADI